MRNRKTTGSTKRRPRLAVWPLRTEKDYEEMRAVVDRWMLDAPEHGPLDDRLEVMLSLLEGCSATAR